MKSDDLNKLWVDIELKHDLKNRFLQRMVYLDMLYRVYIGSTDIPPRRFLSIEIPENEADQFHSFIVPQGFSLTITEPSLKHEGYMACIMKASSSDQNDVFTIVAKDILECLSEEKEVNNYICTLKKRIEKWKDFFKNPANKKLSDKMVIGLIGELLFIKEMKENMEIDISDLWNGPIKASQDFQGENVAVEVKTTVANRLEYVHISSEMQLDILDRESLFLVVYRVERNDMTGITLPKLIKKITSMLNEQQRVLFEAKLTCIGYSDEDSNFYTKGYSLKERKIYKIYDDFPKIIRSDLTQGIVDVRYKLSLQSCSSYEAEYTEVSHAIKEYEYGENRRVN